MFNHEKMRGAKPGVMSSDIRFAFCSRKLSGRRNTSRNAYRCDPATQLKVVTNESNENETFLIVMAHDVTHDVPHVLNDPDASLDAVDTTNPWNSDSPIDHDASTGELLFIVIKPVNL